VPSKPPAIIVAAIAMGFLAGPLEGARSVGAVKGCQFTAGNGYEGEPLARSIKSDGTATVPPPKTANLEPRTALAGALARESALLPDYPSLAPLNKHNQLAHLV
jgi:hypothetical protein